MIAATPKPESPDYVEPAAEALTQTLLDLWPLWLLVAIVGGARLAWRLYEQHRLSRSGIAEVDRMDGGTFEMFLTTLFRRLGYRVEHTGKCGDYGCDLVVVKAGRRTVVQAKRWSKKVGVKAIQEAVSAKPIYGCTEALVVANRAFTRQAQTLARANGVVLWDREVLVRKLLEVGNEPVTTATDGRANGAVVPVPALAAIDARPHCVTCGAVVSKRVRDYCLERPDRFGGRIYCFEHQRLMPLPSAGDTG